MNRIVEKMNELKANGKKAFITYTTAGLPDMETTEKILFAQEEAGIDVCELGVPFSDPVADGPVIQTASYEAILKGATLKKTFELMKSARAKGLNVPVVYMMYYNTVLHYGLKDFVDMCVECGVDGLIIPDLPYEEQGELKAELSRYEDKLLLIPLVSPVSKDRIPMLVGDAKGFVYCVSQMGVTGGNADFHRDIYEYLKTVKESSNAPVMMGFGIRTAQDVLPLKDVIDGAIVGSHFIRLLKESDYDLEAVKNYIREFKSAL